MPTRALRGGMTVPDAAGLRLTSWTITGLIRPEVAPIDGEIHGLIKGTENLTTSGAPYRLVYWNSGGTTYLRTSFVADGVPKTLQYLQAAYTMTVGEWYSVAAGYDAATGAFTLWAAPRMTRHAAGATSFTEVASATLSGPPSPLASSRIVEISPNLGTAGEFGRASFAEWALYTGKLSKATIDARLNTRLTGNESGLVAYWAIDEGTGSAIAGMGAGAGFDGTTIDANPSWVDGPLDLYYGAGKAETGWLGYASATMRPRATLAASDEASGYPATRLRNPRQHIATRTANDTGAKTWTWTLDQSVPVWGLTIRGHNLTSGAVILAQMNETDAWGSPTVNDRVRYRRGMIAHMFTRPYSLGFLRLSITDESNPDAYLELGAVDWWTCYVPLKAPKMGRTLESIDTSTSVVTAHGQRHARDLARYSVSEIEWQDLRRADAFDLYGIARDLEAGAPVWLVHDGKRDQGTVGYLVAAGGMRPATSTGEHWDVGPLTVREDIP